MGLLLLAAAPGLGRGVAPFSITVIQVYAPTSNAEETEVERFYEGLQDLLERTNTQKKMFFSL